MATYYARAGGGNWTTSTTWSLTSGGGATGATPTAADECIFDANSGNVTVNSGAVCRSWTVNGYTGVLTHTAAVTLTIGDATAGTGNAAINFATSGWTYTLGNASTSAVSLASTSATQQTITTAGKTLGNTTFAGVGSSYLLGDAFTSSGTLTITNGTFNSGNFAINVSIFNYGATAARTITLGSSAITATFATSAFTGSGITNLTVTANTATVTATGAFTSNNTAISISSFNWNGLSFSITGGGEYAIVTAGATVANLSIIGIAATAHSARFSGNITITGTLTVTGNSVANRIMLFSNSLASARTITAAAVALTNADFMDITAAGAASPFTGTSIGDALGNTNITFTTPITLYWIGGTGSWSSTSKWSTTSGGSAGSVVPLAHDTVVFDANSMGGNSQIVTIDMPRIGKDIDFTGTTGTGNVISPSSLVVSSFFGNWTLGGAMGIHTSGAGTLIAAGRSTHTITSNGGTYLGAWNIQAPGGTYTLQDDLLTASNQNRQFTFSNGTFDANDQDLAFYVYSFTSSGSLYMGSGTWTINRQLAATSWSLTMTPANVFCETSTIKFSNQATQTQTFAGGGATYNILDYTTAGSVGGLTITGANTFAEFRFSDVTNARTVIFPASTTTTIGSGAGWQVFGTSGKLMTVNSSAGGTPFTLAVATGIVSSDYLSLRDSTASGATPFYAGANSTDVSGNTNWQFTASGTNYTMTVNDSVTITDVAVKAVGKVAADSVTVADAVIKAVALARSDSVTPSDAANKSVGQALADSITAVDVATTAAAYLRSVSDTVTITDLFSYVNAAIVAQVVAIILESDERDIIIENEVT